jgi:hypothetical protein
VQVAELVVSALRDALGIAKPAALEYRDWNDRTQKAFELTALHPGVEPPSAGKSGISQHER